MIKVHYFAQGEARSHEVEEVKLDGDRLYGLNRRDGSGGSDGEWSELLYFDSQDRHWHERSDRGAVIGGFALHGLGEGVEVEVMRGGRQVTSVRRPGPVLVRSPVDDARLPSIEAGGDLLAVCLPTGHWDTVEAGWGLRDHGPLLVVRANTPVGGWDGKLGVRSRASGLAERHMSSQTGYLLGDGRPLA